MLFLQQWKSSAVRMSHDRLIPLALKQIYSRKKFASLIVEAGME